MHVPCVHFGSEQFTNLAMETTWKNGSFGVPTHLLSHTTCPTPLPQGCAEVLPWIDPSIRKLPANSLLAEQKIPVQPNLESSVYTLEDEHGTYKSPI